jgi:hypothetical protein
VGIRETINKNPALSSGAVIAIIVLALAVIVWELSPSRGPKPGDQLYFSDDDGQTFYADAMSNLPPYQHDGKDAVMACVYEAGGQKFIGYLKKYTPELIAEINDPTADADIPSGSLVKRPGDANWVPQKSTQGRDIVTNIKLPPGVTGPAVPVAPDPNE